MAATNDTLTVTDAPAIPGLTFRGEADYAPLVQATSGQPRE